MKYSVFLPLYLFFFFATLHCSDANKPPENAEPVKPQDEYTRESPREWKGMEDEHLPQVVFLNNSDSENIQITVNLLSKSSSHYIERIGIMNAFKKDLAGKSFSQNSSYFMARFKLSPLPSAKDSVKVYVKCNLHDLWTMPLYERQP